MFFSKKSYFLFEYGKAIFQLYRSAKSQNFLLCMNHGQNTDFSKSVNLCPVKEVFLILTPAFSLTKNSSLKILAKILVTFGR